MIGSTQSAAPFSEAERASLRYLCGYPAYGQGSGGFQNWRFFQSYGLLEFRLTNLAPAETQAVRQFLAEAETLRADLLGAGANLDTDAAAVWTRNKNEVRDRLGLLTSWRRELCNLLGVPPGQGLGLGQAGRRVV